MTTGEVVYKLKLEIYKLDSQDYIDLPLPTIITLLNKGILMGVQAVYGKNNLFRQGVEESQLRIDDLQPIMVNDLPAISYVNVRDNIYTGDLPSDYLHLLRSVSTADQDKCLDREIYNQQTIHDDLDEVLVDPNQDANFEWQELPIVIAGNKIWAYSNDTMIPKTLYIEYLKYPIQIDLSGYTHINGVASSDVDSELPDYFLETIITLTAKFIKAILEDGQGIQAVDTALANKDL